MSPTLAAFSLGTLMPAPEKLAEMAVRIALTVLAALVTRRVLFVLIRRIEKVFVSSGRGGRYAEQRARTLGQIARNLSTVVVATAAAIHSLAVLGWDVRPLLTGVGILGVALGFGAQTLVRDVIAGMFILAENQFSVGDLIEVDGRAATVEAISVRSTTLRDFNGYVHFVPNGEMKVVTNRSRGWNRLAVDVGLAPEQNLDLALEVCRAVVDDMNADPPWRERMLDPVELWGIESLTGDVVQVRMVVRARPGADGPEVARELRRRIHRALAEKGLRTSAGREIVLMPALAGEGSIPAAADR